jgi:hypothetical protein
MSERGYRNGPTGGFQGPTFRLPALEQFLTFSAGCLAGPPVALSPRQSQLAKPIFGDALAYERVRIVDGWVMNSPTTLGNYIRINRRYGFDDPTLIHELTHVWQYQTRGPSYISNSFCAQLGSLVATGSRRGAYELPDIDIQRASSILSLSAEQQAVFVAMYYTVVQMRSDPTWQRLIREIRATRPLPPAFFAEEPFHVDAVSWPSGHQASGTVPLLRIDF